MSDIDDTDDLNPLNSNYTISKWNVDGENEDPPAENINCHTSPPIRKIFVGNLSCRVSYRDLRRAFQGYGTVMDTHVCRDKLTRTRTTYGFVTFKEPEDAAKVLDLKQGEMKLHYRGIYVAPADIQHQPIELPDGTVLWKSKSKYLKSPGWDWENNDTSFESESLSNSEQENGATGGCTTSSEEKKDKVEMQEEETCKMHILNDDCLIHVFSFLNKIERIRLERVCKRWQRVLLQMWWCQKSLDFPWLFSANSALYLTCDILAKYLQRCGRNLQKLDLSHLPHNLNPSVLRIIAQYCKNLTCLNLSHITIKSPGLEYLSSVSGKLRELNLDGCSGALDKDLQHLFARSPHLECLRISSNNCLSGKCIRSLMNTSIKELVLNECNNLRSQYLVNGLRQLKNLAQLSLDSCIILTSCDVVNIVAAQPNIKSLSLANYFPSFNNSSLRPLENLSALVSLNLQENPAVNDNIMAVITKKCSNIEEINITGCSTNSSDSSSLTDVGLKCLAQLPKLYTLSMSYLANVSDDSLEVIGSKGKLRTLICRGCPTFSDIGCIRVVTLCNELTLFDFSGCDLVTNATVEAAAESVKNRTNGIKLSLVVGTTQVTHEEAFENIPNLDIDYSDLCLHHRRPDYVDDIYYLTSDEDFDDDVDIIDFDWDDIYDSGSELFHIFSDFECEGDFAFKW